MNLARVEPHPGRENMNSGLTLVSSDFLREQLGEPREDYGRDCRPVTGQRLARRIVTKSVGPFRVTGLDAAVQSLGRVMSSLRKGDPEVYDSLGTAGMLCCRLVRGSGTTLSRHSWGVAIDLTVDGVLHPLGAGGVPLGLLRAYRFFHAEGWYWGAGFRRNDPMHFEASREALTRWLS